MNSGCKSSQDFSPPWCARDRLQHAARQLHGAAQLRRQLPRVHTCAPAAAAGRPAASAGSSASAARARAPGPSTASAAPTARRRGAELALPSAAHKAGRARGQGRAGEPRRRRRHRGCPPRPAACLVEAVPAQAQSWRGEALNNTGSGHFLQRTRRGQLRGVLKIAGVSLGSSQWPPSWEGTGLLLSAWRSTRRVR